jgi:uncharacterized protein (TIGR03437 family)
VLQVALVSTLTAVAQKPVINSQGVVNAASFAGADQPGWAIAPGGIASVFGRNLASGTRAAESLPLPRVLDGTSVTVDGLPAPLFYVSPTQINFQVPSALINFNVAGKGPRQVPVVVATPAGVSDPLLIQVAQVAPGIFTQGARGCGQGAVQNIGADGTRTLNTQAQSVSPGGFVSVYGTALGPVNFAPPDGQPAAADPLPFTQSSVVVRLGLEGFDRQAPIVTYSGRAPGLVGVDQVDVQIPDTAAEGCAVPLRLWTDQASQPVRISIRKGGGQCQDAPPARFASLRWKRIVTTGPEPSARIAEETFTASFSEAPENQVPVLPPAIVQRATTSCPVRDPPVDGPRCPGTGLRALNAGPLILKGLAAGPITVSPDSSFGEIAYAAALPAGSVQPGSVQVEGAGGPEVGVFQSSLPIPPPIEITTPLTPGTVIPADQPFRLTWTGGSPDAVVRMWLISEDAPGTGSGCQVLAPASDGQLTLATMPRDGPGSPLRLPVAARQTARVIVTVMPRQAATFSAPGLTREGTHEWTYEYRFTGLRIRAP